MNYYQVKQFEILDITMVEAINPPKNKKLKFGGLIGRKNRKNKEKQQKIK